MSDSRLYTYELRVRTSMAPAMTSSIARLAGGVVVPRHVVRRLAVMGEEDEAVDLPAVLERLTACDVPVLDVRLCRSPAPRAEDGP